MKSMLHCHKAFFKMLKAKPVLQDPQVPAQEAGAAWRALHSCTRVLGPAAAGLAAPLRCLVWKCWDFSSGKCQNFLSLPLHWQMFLQLSILICPAATLALCPTPRAHHLCWLRLTWNCSFWKNFSFSSLLKLTNQWASWNHCLKQTFQNSDGSLTFKLYIYKVNSYTFLDSFCIFSYKADEIGCLFTVLFVFFPFLNLLFCKTSAPDIYGGVSDMIPMCLAVFFSLEFGSSAEASPSRQLKNWCPLLLMIYQPGWPWGFI